MRGAWTDHPRAAVRDLIHVRDLADAHARAGELLGWRLANSQQETWWERLGNGPTMGWTRRAKAAFASLRNA